MQIDWIPNRGSTRAEMPAVHDLMQRVVNGTQESHRSIKLNYVNLEIEGSPIRPEKLQT